MIIGLSGYARSGKDEVANILIEEFSFTRVAFADPIKELLLEIDPLVKDGFRVKNVVKAYGWDQAKVVFPEVRTLLQTLGVGARKTFGENFWVHQAMNSMASAHPNIVVTDVRFTNEANTLKINGGQLWRINRPGVTAVNDHISEHDLDKYSMDKTLENEGTLDDLRQLVRKNMESALNAN